MVDPLQTARGLGLDLMSGTVRLVIGKGQGDRRSGAIIGGQKTKIASSKRQPRN